MAIEWVYNRLDTADLPRRLDRLVTSLTDERVIPDVALATGSNLIPHGGGARYVSAQLKGAVATIGVSIAAIDKTYVTVHATAACTVDLYVRR